MFTESEIKSIKRYLEANKITETELARRTGLSRSCICRYLKGERVNVATPIKTAVLEAAGITKGEHIAAPEETQDENWGTKEYKVCIFTTVYTNSEDELVLIRMALDNVEDGIYDAWDIFDKKTVHLSGMVNTVHPIRRRLKTRRRRETRNEYHSVKRTFTR